jgi:L-iditol 2-dehydrogenase
MGFDADLIKSAELKGPYDAIIDCSGSRGGLIWAQSRVARGGTLVLVGLGEEVDMRLNGLSIAVGGLSVEGVFRYANTFPAAIHLIQTYRERLQPFVVHRIDLEELPDHLADRRYLDVLKTMVTL